MGRSAGSHRWRAPINLMWGIELVAGGPGLDLCPSMKAAVHTPAGLDLGARTPQEIALSILAEIVATRPRPSGRSLASGEAAVGEPASPQEATDPVCGMTVAMVESSLHLDHDGERIWFCGSGCLRAFAADPSAYATP